MVEDEAPFARIVDNGISAENQWRSKTERGKWSVSLLHVVYRPLGVIIPCEAEFTNAPARNSGVARLGATFGRI
jgi:hypothetical protein